MLLKADIMLQCQSLPPVSTFVSNQKMQFKLHCFTLSIVLIGRILDLAIFNILGAYLSMSSLTRLLAGRAEIAYQRFLVSAPQPVASPQTKFYQERQSRCVLTE